MCGVTVEEVSLGDTEVVNDDDVVVDGFKDEMGDLRGGGCGCEAICGCLGIIKR